MIEMQFYENGQGYTKDLIQITNEKFADRLLNELDKTNYKIAEFKQSQERFVIYLLDNNYSCHIKVLSFSFVHEQIQLENIWRTDLETINFIFSEKVKS